MHISWLVSLATEDCEETMGMLTLLRNEAMEWHRDKVAIAGVKLEGRGDGEA